MKKQPQRTCIVCRTKGDKQNFVRVVRGVDNSYSLDPTGKANGRGAYICNNPNCIQKCLKTKALNRAYKTNIGEATYNTIAEKYNVKN